ncbi:MAG: hypothetical protein KKA05_01195, partial [Alphaproteobacteria bacterium]|nr:hypothetical protein [Alphaproteobacteria bacterium]
MSEGLLDRETVRAGGDQRHGCGPEPGDGCRTGKRRRAGGFFRRRGGGGVIGNDFVAKAQPDGYTVLVGITQIIQAPS